MQWFRCVPTLLLAAGLQADTLTLSPDADTAMLSLNPQNNYGGLMTVPVGPVARAGHVARALFRFDVAGSLPAGAVVTNVTLRFQVSRESSTGPADIAALHRMRVDWAEGSKTNPNHGSAASPGESNWRSRRSGIADWAGPGGAAGTDFESSPGATAAWDGPGAYTFGPTDALIADVQSWLDHPAANHGWMLKSLGESATGAAKRVVTREGPQSQRPALVIGFTVPAVFQPSLEPPVIAATDLELRYALEPGFAYELRGFPEPGAAFQVLTNHTVKFTAENVLFLDPLTAPQRFYQLVITGEVD